MVESNVDIAKYLNSNFDRFIGELQRWCQQPSVSGTGQGIEEMAELVRCSLEKTGLKTSFLSGNGGNPVIFAELKGLTEKTILFYNHYDVQPVEPLKAWHSPPFGAEIEEGRLTARGAADNKGCLLSRIHAIETVLNARETLPVGVKFLIEGEEELGSPHLRSVVEANKELLKADACIWEYAEKNGQRRPTMTLGNKGICYMEMSAFGANHDVHSMYAPLHSNAAWRLVWALSTLKDETGKILIDGFFEDLEAWSDEEIASLDEITLDVSGHVHYSSTDLREQKRCLFGEPTCTICGLTAGFQGEGMKTIVPSKATAKLDLRLVASQNPRDICEKVRRHLDRRGFGDVQVHLLAAIEPSTTHMKDPFVEIVARASNKAYREQIVILPTSPGSGPRDVFSSWTSMPIIGLGVGNAGSAVHGPNENILLQDYREGILHIVSVLEEFGS